MQSGLLSAAIAAVLFISLMVTGVNTLVAVTEPATPEPQATSPASRVDAIHRLPNGFDVYELRLTDGTRCVVHSSTTNGSVTCEWLWEVEGKVSK